VAEQYRDRARPRREKARVESAYAENAARDAAPPQQLSRNSGMSNKLKINIAGSTAASTAAFAAANHRRETASKADRDKTNAALGAVGGVGAADAAYVAGGQGAKKLIRRHRQAHWNNKLHNPIWNEHRRKVGVEQAQSHTPNALKRKLYEGYPKKLPGWKAQRALAYKNRPGVQGATYTAAGLLGAHMASKPKHTKANDRSGDLVGVGKRVVDAQTKTHPGRVALAGAGGVGLAWGTPRVKMIGVGLRAGFNEAESREVRRALVHAESARRSWLTGTEGVGRAAGKLPGASVVRRAIPAKLRPAAAVVGGGAAIRAAMPVRETTYQPVPVMMRRYPAAQGW
jgi:hypothetical protein